LQTGAELQRQKLLIEANSKDRERHAIALQNRDEPAQVEKQREREIAEAEAGQEMKLAQQLAVQKQRAAILQKDNNSSGDEIANANFFYNIAHVEASAYAH